MIRPLTTFREDRLIVPYNTNLRIWRPIAWRRAPEPWVVVPQNIWSGRYRVRPWGMLYSSWPTLRVPLPIPYIYTLADEGFVINLGWARKQVPAMSEKELTDEPDAGLDMPFKDIVMKGVLSYQVRLRLPEEYEKRIQARLEKGERGIEKGDLKEKKLRGFLIDFVKRFAIDPTGETEAEKQLENIFVQWVRAKCQKFYYEYEEKEDYGMNAIQEEVRREYRNFNGLDEVKNLYLTIESPAIRIRIPTEIEKAKRDRYAVIERGIGERYAAEQRAIGIRATGEAEAYAIEKKGMAEATVILAKANANAAGLRQIGQEFRVSLGGLNRKQQTAIIDKFVGVSYLPPGTTLYRIEIPDYD